MQDAGCESGKVSDIKQYAHTDRAKWWALIMLMCAGATSFFDRQILSLLIIPIQTDLNISDTQISLLLGFAFVGTYVLAGLPLGRLVDRTRRFRLIAVGIAFWSVMTALCASAVNYWQLFLLRMGVGVGEASLNPAAYSLMADLFPRRRLGLAIGLFSLGIMMGGGLVMAVGGTIIGQLLAHKFTRCHS